MLAFLEDTNRALAAHLAEADPHRVSGADAAKVFAAVAETERLVGALRVLFTKRAADSMTWRDQGDRSAATWMADQTKSAVGDAVATLEVAGALEKLPGTTEALRRGQLSTPQVRAIAAAAARRPGVEDELLAVAATHSLKGLKERCAQVRAVASSAAEEMGRYQAIRDARYLRHWTDADGAFRLDGRLTPDAGAVVACALAAQEKVCFDEARARDEELPPGAAMADALVRLLGDGPGAVKQKGGSKTTPATLVIRADATAFRRGHVEGGETCMIPGIGPVPVAVARRQLPEAFLKILVTDGVDVQAVCHVGRAVPVVVQSALEERDPVCVVPGCDVALGLENHHWDVEFSECRSTSLRGLARVCHWHHDLITYEGYVLQGGPGKWELVPPVGGTDFDTS